MDFVEVVHKRRSCRIFTAEKVPEGVIENALRDALMAPNSSNMQLWKFYWIQSPSLKEKMVKACLNQSAARTAQDFIVCVADWSQWRDHRHRMLEVLKKDGAPAGVVKYYEKLIPLMYSQGFLGLSGLLKKILTTIVGFVKPVPRSPFSVSDVAMVAVKSCALACENLMLSIYNQGFACCPMEGFDEKLVLNLIDSPRTQSRVTMVISVGRADSKGISSKQIRFDHDLFIRKL